MADKIYTIKSAGDVGDNTPDWEMDEILAGKHPVLLDAQKYSSIVPKTMPVGQGGMSHSATPTQDDTTFGMGTGQLIAAGAGQTVNDWITGISNKAKLLNLPRDGGAQEAIIARIESEKADREGIREKLDQNPAAVFGGLVPNIAAGVVAPATLPAQMVVQGGLGALPSPRRPVDGPLSELAGSGYSGLKDALATYLGGKAVHGVQRGANAILGNYSPLGKELMTTSDAARRLGLPSPSIGELNPGSIFGVIHQAGFDRPERILSTGSALERKLAAPTLVTGATPGAVESQMIPGKALSDELSGAIERYFVAGKSNYSAVDNAIVQNGLSNVVPQRAFNELRSIATVFTPATGARATPVQALERNPVIALAKQFDDNNALDHLISLTVHPNSRYVQQELRNGMLMSTYHDARVAVGKAWRKLDRDATIAKPSELSEIKRYKKALMDLQSSLDTDANVWAAQNAGNAEAMKLYNHAKDFWRTVVVPRVHENDVAEKLISKYHGYGQGAELMRDVADPRNREFLSRLQPQLSRSGSDMVRVIQNLPESANYAISGHLPPPNPAMGGLTQVLPASIRPITRAIGSLGGNVGGEAAKRLYASRLAQGATRRLGYGAAQYPAAKVEEWIDSPEMLDNP